MVGLVVKRPHGGLRDDPFFTNLIGALVGSLAGGGSHLCVDLVESDKGQEAVYEELLRSRRVDGLILVEPQARDERIHKLQDEGFPFVLIGNPGEGSGIWSVDNDNVAAGELATQHLVEVGYRRIAMIAGPPGVAVSDDRVAGYRRAIRGVGREEQVIHSRFGFDAAAQAAREALAAPLPPDAFVVLDDFMAMGMLQALRKAGLRVPDAVGIVSFNDSRLCELLDVGLTSMSLNLDAIVAAACQRLLAIIDDVELEGPRRILVPCDLVVRGSSRGPGGEPC